MRCYYCKAWGLTKVCLSCREFYKVDENNHEVFE